MPREAPPPPPPLDEPETWPEETEDFVDYTVEDEEPYAIALFDYFTDHADDLCFSVSKKK